MCVETQFETLQELHAEALFRFELENRDWFEERIAPRDSHFYSLNGIQEHIRSLCQSMETGIAHSFLLLSDGCVIARANLKDVCLEAKTATIGYRVARSSTNRGVGTKCVVQLLAKAQLHPNIEQVFAFVLDNNPASKRILLKSGFTPFQYHEEYYSIKGITYGCTQMLRSLS